MTKQQQCCPSDADRRARHTSSGTSISSTGSQPGARSLRCNGGRNPDPHAQGGAAGGSGLRKARKPTVSAAIHPADPSRCSPSLPPRWPQFSLAQSANPLPGHCIVVSASPAARARNQQVIDVFCQLYGRSGRHISVLALASTRCLSACRFSRGTELVTDAPRSYSHAATA